MIFEAQDGYREILFQHELKQLGRKEADLSESDTPEDAQCVTERLRGNEHLWAKDTRKGKKAHGVTRDLSHFTSISVNAVSSPVVTA